MINSKTRCICSFPGVKNASCGDADKNNGFIQFNNGVIITGFKIRENNEKSMAEEDLERGYSHCRGHLLQRIKGKWVYADNREPYPGDGGEIRPCKKCGSTESSNEGHVDECLGQLPGVTNACCGHGAAEGSYICFENGVTIVGFTVSEGLKK